MNFRKSWKLILFVLPYVAAVIGLKLLVHRLGLEIIPLNAIFSALIGATVFLIGFLISGVLSDYKESERLPGEISSIVLTMVDEIAFVRLKCGDDAFARERLGKARDLIVCIRNWFHKEAKTGELMSRIEDLSAEFALLERHTPPNYIARLKQEQNNLRKIITRIHTIRETDFIFSGYFIASTTTLLLIAGMIFLRLEPFSESLFFVGLVTYLLLFLLRLIRDLDNPFGHYDRTSFEDVSLKPIHDAIARIDGMIAAVAGAGPPPGRTSAAQARIAACRPDRPGTAARARSGHRPAMRSRPATSLTNCCAVLPVRRPLSRDHWIASAWRMSGASATLIRAA